MLYKILIPLFGHRTKIRSVRKEKKIRIHVLHLIIFPRSLISLERLIKLGFHGFKDTSNQSIEGKSQGRSFFTDE
uniref:Uncharacterized protein n=1 Tax=Lepeophtheirus salmonis TaxID=72036 RepID=A0A0K2UP81_LEPSM